MDGNLPSQSQVKKDVATGPEPEGCPTERKERRREGQNFAKGSWYVQVLDTRPETKAMGCGDPVSSSRLLLLFFFID